LRTSATATVVLDGGKEIVFGALGVEESALIASGGLAIAAVGGNIVGTISGGVVEVNDIFSFANVSFATSAGGTVRLGEAGDWRNDVDIGGFAAGDVIDFRAIALSGSTLSWNQLVSGAAGSGTLSVSSGGTSASITLLGNYVGGQTVSVT